MKLVADSRGRITAADIFTPGTAFEAIPLPNGHIMLYELTRKEMPTVRPRRVKGKLRGAAIELPRDIVAAAVRAERDER